MHKGDMTWMKSTHTMAGYEIIADAGGSPYRFCCDGYEKEHRYNPGNRLYIHKFLEENHMGKVKKVFVLVLALMMCAVALVGCGGGKGNAANNPAIGKYIGNTIDVMGEQPFDSVYGEGDNYIELQASGKGTFCLDGDPISIKWKLDGVDLTLTVEGVDCTGTLENDMITIDYFDMGIVMTFVK